MADDGNWRRWEVHADHRAPFGRDLDLYILAHGIGRNELSVIVTGFTFTIYEPGRLCKPTLEAGLPPDGLGDVFGSATGASFSHPSNVDLLQAFLDCAWRSGLRPTGYDASEEKREAMGRHLEDMRALVFHYSKAEKP
jgi:hypothetical protein